ncbi:MAG TPA: lipase family protein [Blastocatellia bacterium]
MRLKISLLLISIIAPLVSGSKFTGGSAGASGNPSRTPQPQVSTHLADKFKPEVTPQDQPLDPVNAVICAYASYKAYSDGKDVETLLNDLGMNKPEFFDGRSAGTQGMVTSTDKFVLLAFRGTEPERLLDLLTDARFYLDKRSWTEGKVHNGFADALDAVWDTVKTQVKKQAEKSGDPKPLWITGHSLGGALATLAAYRFHRDGLRVNGVVTFGAPRVGNNTFKESFESNIISLYRFAHRRDPVPNAPPKLLEIGYVDFSRILSPDQPQWAPQRTPNSYYLVEIPGHVSGEIRRRQIPNMFRYHEMQGYLNATKKRVPANDQSLLK